MTNSQQIDTEERVKNLLGDRQLPELTDERRFEALIKIRRAWKRH